MILSASRRTDIPGHYSEWFLKRLKKGYVLTKNPMNPSQMSRILLSPKVIDCIVFWTKDPHPMMNKLKLLDQMGYLYYFQFTFTPYGNDVERNLRNKEEIIQTFIELSETIGKEKVFWRYDPIIINDEYNRKYHRESFSYLCDRLCKYTDSATISFVDMYRKFQKQAEINRIRTVTEKEMHQLASDFSQISKKYNVMLKACSETIDLSPYGIRKASCIDQTTIEGICGYTLDVKKDSNQRSGCGCIQSIDIGVYNTCKNGCIYCYANYSSETVERNYNSHNPESEILVGSVNSRINNREMKSLRKDQHNNKL